MDKIRPISSHELSKWVSHFENLFEKDPSLFSSSEMDQYLQRPDEYEISGSSDDGSSGVEDQWFSSGNDSQSEERPRAICRDAEEFLSFGAFGSVSKMKQASGAVVALKRVLRTCSGGRAIGNVSRLDMERRCWESLSSVPTAINLIRCNEKDEFLEFVMPYQEGGDLFDRLARKGRIAEADLACVCGAVADFLKAAHGKGIMHRDLKPENILLKSADSDRDVCVADFGLATYFVKGEKLSERVGTAPYMSPNMLQGSYGPETDLWSLGVTLHLLLTGKELFQGESNEETLQQVKEFTAVDFRGPRWSIVSEEAKDLVSRLLEKQEGSRITVDEVLCHPWVLLYYKLGEGSCSDSSLSEL